MPRPAIDSIRQALAEDGAESDITTLSTVPAGQQARASIIARKEGIIAGLEVAIATFQELDPRIAVEQLVKDGEPVHAGQVLARLSGPARSILSAERVAMNFLGHLSGIATITAQCVRAIAGTNARIL
ncbi:MAG TPA: nicotinate-nucleotide diphosphorylase (carboxylating), partial [Ktedonobacteraceae bacterium]|nr:nicotinate-nucleotide diphosphorylase (carboxylating) [Ktedonobacteraceae bacterium]